MVSSLLHVAVASIFLLQNTAWATAGPTHPAPTYPQPRPQPQPQRVPKAKLRPLFSKGDGKTPGLKCINLGSPKRSDGAFMAERTFVRYEKKDASKPRQFGKYNIRGTVFEKAFRTQRVGSRISFSIRVQPGFSYSGSVGFTQIKSCKKGNRVLKVKVGEHRPETIDVFDRAGCNFAYLYQFSKVVPNKFGLIKFDIQGVRGLAFVSGFCINGEKRVTGSVPPPTRPPTRTTRTRRPTTRPPTTQPTTTIPKGLVPSICQQSGCVNFEGHGDYVVIGNSMSRSESRVDCTIDSSSSAQLNLPHHVAVKHAVLFWSASGRMTGQASARLNGAHVTAAKTYTSTAAGIHFYGAELDVTHLVKNGGQYTVDGLYFENHGSVCHLNAAYAAWSLAVVYEDASLPAAKINLCTNEFHFTYPQQTYTRTVQCAGPSTGDGGNPTARTTIVTFESDAYKGEEFSINDVFQGDNLFRGTTAPNLDINTYNVGHLLASGTTDLRLKLRSYLTDTVFGKAIEGLFMPMVAFYRAD